MKNLKKYVRTLGIALTLAMPAAAHAQTVAPPPVPTKLEVEPPNEVFLVGHGVGTQNYECQPVRSLGRVDWVLFTPQATLFDERDEQLITHFFSPNPSEDDIVRVTWEDSRDTSRVWGRVIEQSVDAAFVKAGAIPWLLIDVEHTGAQAGPTGGEALVHTTFIQRLNTEGGAAPSTGCERPTDVGKKKFVPYEADYFFYKR
jgi:Protein of unknown function (DUF3455)